MTLPKIEFKKPSFLTVLIFSTVIITICLMALGYISWPVADDFCNQNDVNKFGLFPFVWRTYNRWSGRIISTFFISAAFSSLGVPRINILSALLGLLIIIIPFLITRIAKFNLKTSLIFIITTVFILWIGMRDIMGEIVFWPTGGMVYVLPFTLSLFWIYSYLKLHDQPTNKLKLFLFFIFSIITGNLIEQIPLPLIAIVTILFFNYKDKNKPLFFSSLIGLVIGALILYTAPGNFNRATFGKDSFNLDFDFLLKSYFALFTFYWQNSQKLIIVSLLTLPVSLSHIGSLTKEIKIKPIIWSFLFFLSANLVILPMVVVKDFAAPRTSMFFMFYLYFSIVFVFIHFKNGLFSELIQNLFAVALTMALVAFIGLDFRNGYRIKTQMIQREKLILDTQTTTVPAIKGGSPKSLHFNDITEDDTIWINACLSQYYKLPKIKAVNQ